MTLRKNTWIAAVVGTCSCLFLSPSARAEDAFDAREAPRRSLRWHPDGAEAGQGNETKAVQKPDRASHIPRAAYTFSAFGANAPSVGLAGVGSLYGPFKTSAGDPQGGGGLHVWGAPIDRLTLLAEFERRMGRDEAAPSAGFMVRALGDLKAGWALAGLARYKAEGFAELEGEVEGGLAGSFAHESLHLDTNAIFGSAMEEKEVDGEWLLRAGVDVLDWLRLGVDGRVRYRLAGDKALAGGRTWDAVGGPQGIAVFGQFFGSLTAGPTTVGIADGVGWSALAMFGGVAP